METSEHTARDERHASGVRKSRSTAFKACFRCHRRKQRCKGYPSCSNCQSANAVCTRDSTVVMRKLAVLSKEELLDRIDSLEARLLVDPHTNPLRDHLNSPTESESRQREPCQPEQEPQTRGTPINLENSIAETTVSQHFTTVASEPDQADALLPWPDDEIGKQIIDTYLESMYRRVPFFEFSQVVDLHERRYNNLTAKDIPPFSVFRLYMVYAIGATILKLNQADLELEDYFAIADRFKNSIESLTSVERIEASLFTVLYRLRISLDSSAWHEIGVAMRLAIEEGMNREVYYTDLDPITADWRRRLFYGVYIVERNICFSLKRPYSIANHDINATPPSSSLCLQQPQDAGNLAARLNEKVFRPLDLSTFVAMVDLVRIKSEIHTAIYRLDKDISFAHNQVPVLLQQLRDFERTLPAYAGSDQDFLQLHVENAIRTLIEPFLTILEPTDHLMTICIHAAGRVCQLFKRLRLCKKIGYSFTMVNSVFVAGMTMCYILTKNSLLWTPSLANDLRACSSILFVIAERNHTLRKYCDVLEVIINGVMQHIEQATTSSSIEFPETTSPRNSGQGSPIAFHKLTDTFKEFGFELPSHVYPTYTKNSEQRSALSSCSPEQSVATRLDSQSINAEPSDANIGLHFGSDMLTFAPGSWEFDGLYDNSGGNQQNALYLHEPFTQQMMNEMLAQNYYHGSYYDRTI